MKFFYFLVKSVIIQEPVLCTITLSFLINISDLDSHYFYIYTYLHYKLRYLRDASHIKHSSLPEGILHARFPVSPLT